MQGNPGSIPRIMVVSSLKKHIKKAAGNIHAAFLDGEVKIYAIFALSYRFHGRMTSHKSNSAKQFFRQSNTTALTVEFCIDSPLVEPMPSLA